MNEQDKKQFVDQATELMNQYNKQKMEWNQNMIKEVYKNDLHKQNSRIQNEDKKI